MDGMNIDNEKFWNAWLAINGLNNSLADGSADGLSISCVDLSGCPLISSSGAANAYQSKIKSLSNNGSTFNLPKAISPLVSRINSIKTTLEKNDEKTKELFDSLTKEAFSDFVEEGFGEDVANECKEKIPIDSMTKFFLEGFNNDVDPQNIWNSWFGVENDAAYEAVQFLFGTAKKALGESSKKETKDRWKTDKVEQVKIVDNDNPYRVGKKLPYGNVSIWSHTIHNLDFEVAGDSGIVGDESKKGSYASYDYDVLYAKGKTTAKVGPGYIGADADYEAGVFQISGDAQAMWTTANGQELLGASASGEISVAEAYLKGKAVAGGYTDEFGRHHTEVGVQAKIGADFVKAEGSVSGNVLGLEATAGGAVKLGLGAQFDLGFEDGEFKCHAGLACGPGVEVYASINVGGLVGNVIDWGNQAYEAAKPEIDKIKEDPLKYASEKVNQATTWAAGAWDDTKSWAAGAWDDTKSWASDKWDDTKSWASDKWDTFTGWLPWN